MKIFRNIKRIISQYLETEYWYRFRKLNRLWYNEDDNKWHNVDKRSYPYKARDILTSTWEGEHDLWCSMLLKLEHMFWNLKEYGNEANYYFYQSDIEKYGNNKDKEILAKKIIKSALFDEHKFFKSHKLYIGSGQVDKNISADGKLSIYLCYYKDTRYLTLEVETAKVIPFEQIKKKNKMYTLKSYIDENGKKQFKHEETTQYKKRAGLEIEKWKILDDWTENETLDYVLNRIDSLMNKRLKEFLESYDIIWESITMLNIAMNRLNQYSPQIEIKEIPLFSKKLRQYATGNFVKCKRILHLRRLIKKLINLDDSKYDYMWIDEIDEEKRFQSMKEARVHYEADKKQLYYDIANYMLEYAENWWD